MKTSELYYDLPPERIAQRPCEPRDASRLMVVDRAAGQIEHCVFRELPRFLRGGDCLVINDTRVLPARFKARRVTGGVIEGLFVSETRPGIWQVMLDGVRRLREGEQLTLGDSRWGMIFRRRIDAGVCEVEIQPAAAAVEVLREIGSTPLPPYIRREPDDGDISQVDRERYQTIYAAADGSVAAPTAGLHFTEGLLEEIRAGGVTTANVTLHVGPGTFAPIKSDDLGEHRMHHEWYSLEASQQAVLEGRRANGGRIVAVGSTSARTLESCAEADGSVQAGEGWTDLLIYPPYAFKAVDVLLTNFHLPGSTLLALVFAFAGTELMKRAYAEAIAAEYRFFSYGDAMLIV